MSGRFMKVKKILLPVITVIILTSQLAGCATVTSNEMLELLENGNDVEISISVPAYNTDTLGIEQQTVQDRIQLDRLQTYTIDGFRQEFDSIFNIRELELTNSTSKLGCIYINAAGFHEGNTVLMDSLRNQVWVETYFKQKQDEIGQAATLAYIDVDGDDYASVMGALNAYYNLLNDSENGEDTYFNANQSVTRGEFYSFVYRATSNVNNFLKTQGDFINQVGTQDKDSLYASQVDQYGWLNADNGGLRPENYKGSISRAEAVYMLMNMYFSDELAAIDVNSISLEDAKDGGNYWDDTIPDKKISNALYDEKDESKDLVNGWQLGALSKMLSSGGNGVQTDLYKALGVAFNLGIIDSETRWDEPISKTEAIDMLVQVGMALNERDGYLCSIEDGDYSMFVEKELEFTEDDVVENVVVDEETGVETGIVNGEAYSTGGYDMEQAKANVEAEKKAEEQATANNNSGNSSSSSPTPSTSQPTFPEGFPAGTIGDDDGSIVTGGQGSVENKPGDENIKFE